MNNCTRCRDWGKFERHEDHAEPSTLAQPLTIYSSGPDHVTWAKGHSRSITSRLRFLEHRLSFVEEHGWTDIAGQRLDESDVLTLLTEMTLAADSAATDLIAERVADHSQEADR